MTSNEIIENRLLARPAHSNRNRLPRGVWGWLGNRARPACIRERRDRCSLDCVRPEAFWQPRNTRDRGGGSARYSDRVLHESRTTDPDADNGICARYGSRSGSRSHSCSRSGSRSGHGFFGAACGCCAWWPSGRCVALANAAVWGVDTHVDGARRDPGLERR